MLRLLLFCLISTTWWCYAENLELKATPQTVVWGYYSSAAKPLLTIHSGDTVRVETVSGNPARLEAAGARADQIPDALRAIYKEVTDRGPGGHILTGPFTWKTPSPGMCWSFAFLRSSSRRRLHI